MQSTSGIMNSKPVLSAGIRRQYVSAAEAEEITGVSRWTWRRKAYAGSIASTKVGTRLLIAVDELERVLAEGTRPRVQVA